MRYPSVFVSLSALVLIAATAADAGAQGGSGAAPVVPAAEAIAGAHVETLDPHTLTPEEIRQVLGGPAVCSYHYTSAGAPVVAFGPPDATGGATAALKVNGKLIRFNAIAFEDGVRLADGPITIAIAPALLGDRIDGERVAIARFEIWAELEVGYKGYYRCGV